MSGHHQFSQLTKDFSPARKADIAQRTNQLREEMALAELRQARQLSQPNSLKSLTLGNLLFREWKNELICMSLIYGK